MNNPTPRCPRFALLPRFGPAPIKALAAALALLGGCTVQSPSAGDTTEITILAINDFHGHIQSSDPIPRMIEISASPRSPSKTMVAAGGAAYLATELATLRAAHPNNITVGVGDLIGASPMTSSMLDDEPAIEVLNRLGLNVSTVGNHEFDQGRDALERRIQGRCPAAGCKWPQFRGARFDYLARL